MARRSIFPGSPPEGTALTDVLLELQGIKVSVVNGAAADTNIAVTGLTNEDDVVAVLYFPISGGNVTGVQNLTSEVAARTAGNIQLSDTATTGGRLVVLWLDKGGA